MHSICTLWCFDTLKSCEMTITIKIMCHMMSPRPDFELIFFFFGCCSILYISLIWDKVLCSLRLVSNLFFSHGWLWTSDPTSLASKVLVQIHVTTSGWRSIFQNQKLHLGRRSACQYLCIFSREQCFCI